MPYCPQCGVELEPEAPRCPLCGTPRHGSPPESLKSPSPPELSPLPGATGGEAPRGMFPETGDPTLFTLGERKKIAWEVISVAAAVAATTLGAINAAVSQRLSWSLYPLASLAFSWILASGILVLDRRPLLMYLAIFASTPLFLLAIDAIETGLDWSLSLGIPLALLVEAIIAAAAVSLRALERKGLNVVAVFLFCAAALLVGIEGLVGLFLRGRVVLTWSLISLLSLVPMALFLLYLHVRIAHSTNLRRMFRL